MVPSLPRPAQGMQHPTNHAYPGFAGTLNCSVGLTANSANAWGTRRNAKQWSHEDHGSMVSRPTQASESLAAKDLFFSQISIGLLSGRRISGVWVLSS